jgi:hypothetical protein
MKKTSSFIFLVVICASLAMLTSCEYDIVVPEKAPPIIAGDTISFHDDVVISVFNASCNPSCHKTGGIAPDLSAANAYSALTTGGYVVDSIPAQSQIYTDCKPGGIMETYCSTEQLNLIYRWISAGAKNN